MSIARAGSIAFVIIAIVSYGYSLREIAAGNVDRSILDEPDEDLFAKSMQSYEITPEQLGNTL